MRIHRYSVSTAILVALGFAWSCAGGRPEFPAPANSAGGSPLVGAGIGGAGIGGAGIGGAGIGGAGIGGAGIGGTGIGGAGIGGAGIGGAGPSTGPGAVGKLGESCAPNGTYACAGYGQRAQLACVGGVWAMNGSCMLGQNCDTREGQNAGFCAPIAGECTSRKAGEAFCQNKAKVACGADLLSVEQVEACTGACVLGTCTACEPGAKQCTNNGVQTCDGNGAWGVAVGCVEQVCTGAGVCTACAPGTKQCMNNGVQTCDGNGAWGGTQDCADSTPVCSGAGDCKSPPSCVGLPATCGGAAGNVNCCTSGVVDGGTFKRSDDMNFPATVSAFRLDKYEVTVGRFRKFVEAYKQDIIPAGAGKNVSNAADLGWDKNWNALLPANKGALETALLCLNSPYATLTNAAGTNQNRPINCVNWYEAQAFCTWDGGRLPTEAEWNYAAAGGNEQQLYPWVGSAAPMANASLAVYGCHYPTAGGTCTGVANIAPVGSVTAVNGKWGQSDLAGNMWEWTQDWYGTYPIPCINCANFSTLSASARVLRGGVFNLSASYLTSAYRAKVTPASHSDDLGLRCARTR